MALNEGFVDTKIQTNEYGREDHEVWMTYPSITEFVEACDVTATKVPLNLPVYLEQRRYNVNAYGGDTWGMCDAHTGPSYNYVLGLMQNGWHRGLALMEEALAAPEMTEIPTPVSRKRRKVRGDHGDELDLHRVYAGDLDHAWTRAARRRTAGPQRITIYSDIAGNGGTSGLTLFWRGAATIRLADVLTNAGYAVEIIATEGTRWGEWRKGNVQPVLRSMVVVKNCHDQLDRLALTTILALPAFYRTLCFAWCAAYAPVQVSGVGGAVSLTLGPNDMVTNSYINSAATAKQWVTEQLVRLNEMEREVA